MHQRMSLLLAGAVLSVLCATSTQADPPAEWVVNYGIHETPSDPASPIIFMVTLALTRADMQGNSVGWDIGAIEIRQVALDRTPIASWIAGDPSVATTDGLWWVEHADPNAPATQEFNLPPYVEGTAKTQDPNGTDLLYALQGQVYTPPPHPETAPYEVTVAMGYSFALVGSQAVLLDKSEEPVEGNPPVGD